ncbi:hypothetical protein [Bradyrhizobium sp. LeoA1S1]
MTDFIKALQDEIDAAMPVDRHSAIALVNGTSSRPGLRAKYKTLVDREFGAGRWSERLHGDTAQRVQTACDWVISAFHQPQCATTGWSSLPRTAVEEFKLEEDRQWARDFASRVVRVEFE